MQPACNISHLNYSCLLEMSQHRHVSTLWRPQPRLYYLSWGTGRSQPVVALMLGCTLFLLWVAFGNVTRAFRSPSSLSQRIIAVHVARYHQTTSTSSLKTNNNVRGDKFRHSISQTDDDTRSEEHTYELQSLHPN